MNAAGPVLVVTGTRREAAVLSPEGLEVLAGGGAAERLVALLAEKAPRSAGVISFGMAGALDPALKLGGWVIGTSVTGGYDAPCDARWVEALVGRMPGAMRGAVFADGRMFTSAREKAGHAAATGALAVDMESHLVAEAAARAAVPFVVLRCISDTAEADLPPAIRVSMRPDGGVAVGAMLLSLLRQPGQVGDFVRTIWGFARAYRMMGEGARQVAGRLGFDLR